MKEIKGLTDKCTNKLISDMELILSSDKIEGVEYIKGEKYVILK